MNNIRNFLSLFFSQFTKLQKLVSASFILAVVGLFMAVPLTRADNVKFDSARDCDGNAVIHCGAMSTNELIEKYNSNGSAKDIYDYFGISKADVNNIKQNVVAGKVTADGQVKVNGKVVATNAKTAGRHNMAGSRQVNHQGTTFYVRKPSVSFQSNNLDAYVVMKNGVFDYAVIASCGNPVDADGKTNPKYELTKHVRVNGGDWVKAANVNYGQQFEYKIVVKSTGTGPVKHLNIRDVVPAGVTRIPNTLTKDGEPANDSAFFSNEGMNIARVAQDDKKTFIFKATTNPTTQPKPCTEKSPINVVHTKGGGLPAKSDKATVTIKCKAIPTNPNYEIVKQVQLIGSQKWVDSVTVPNGSQVRYRIVVTSNGSAPVTNLVISDKLPAGVTYTNGTLTRDGAKVTNASQFFGQGINIGSLAPGKSTTFVFQALVGSKDKSAKCSEGKLDNVASIKADKLPAKSDNALVDKKCAPQKVTCDLLTATSLGNRSFRFNIKYSATNGATYKTTSYDFGDKTSVLVTDKTTVEHTYAADGTFLATATVTFMVNGKTESVTSENCKVKISSSTPPNMCPLPGKENFPADDPNCSEEETPVTVEPEALPSTGPSEMVGLIAGASFVGAAGHKLWVYRRRG